MKHKIDGMALINSSYNNLEWWINNKATHGIDSNSYKQIQKIKQNFKSGIENIYRYKLPGLTKQIDNDLPQLIHMDIEAHAIDFRIIHNPPLNGVINEGRLTRANPYNMSLYEF